MLGVAVGWTGRDNRDHQSPPDTSGFVCCFQWWNLASFNLDITWLHVFFNLTYVQKKTVGWKKQIKPFWFQKDWTSERSLNSLWCVLFSYCWWKIFCTRWYGKYHITYRVFIHPRWCRISETSTISIWPNGIICQQDRFQWGDFRSSATFWGGKMYEVAIIWKGKIKNDITIDKSSTKPLGDIPYWLVHDGILIMAKKKSLYL